jgi:uncharacterized protein YggE
METAPGGNQTADGGLDDRRSTRRRWLPLAALAGLVALAAAGGGAVAAGVVKHTDSIPAAAAGPSIYIPYAGGQGQGQGSSSGSGGATNALAPAVAQGGAADFSSSAVLGNSSYLYPYPYAGFCSGGAPAQVSGQVITATGMARIDTGTVTPAYVLNASVNNHSSGDLNKEVSDVQARINAVADALVKAGVPRSSIHTSNISVWASGGGKGGVVPVPQVLPGNVNNTPVVQVNVNASLYADLGGTSSIDSAVSAATGAGADNVNVYTQGPVLTTPSADKVAAALTLAVSQAKSLADAASKSAGVTLGGVHSLSTQQPTLCGYGPDGPQLVVAATVAYDFK